jgi:hypothetical protein
MLLEQNAEPEQPYSPPCSCHHGISGPSVTEEQCHIGRSAGHTVGAEIHQIGRMRLWAGQRQPAPQCEGLWKRGHWSLLPRGVPFAAALQHRMTLRASVRPPGGQQGAGSLSPLRQPAEGKTETSRDFHSALGLQRAPEAAAPPPGVPKAAAGDRRPGDGFRPRTPSFLLHLRPHLPRVPRDASAALEVRGGTRLGRGARRDRPGMDKGTGVRGTRGWKGARRDRRGTIGPVDRTEGGQVDGWSEGLRTDPPEAQEWAVWRE